jgi:hypothetical protein
VAVQFWKGCLGAGGAVVGASGGGVRREVSMETRKKTWVLSKEEVGPFLRAVLKPCSDEGVDYVSTSDLPFDDSLFKLFLSSFDDGTRVLTTGRGRVRTLSKRPPQMCGPRRRWRGRTLLPTSEVLQRSARTNNSHSRF